MNNKIEPISLLGKSVKIDDPYLLQFFYPDLAFVRSDKDYQAGMNNFIYLGNYKLLGTFNTLGLKYIAAGTVPTYDYDFTDKSQLINFVYSKFGKTPPKYIDEDLLSFINTEEFVFYCKMLWVTGVWFGPKEAEVNKSFEFILSLCNDPYLTVFENYWKLDFDISNYLFKFLSNAINMGDSKKGKYKELLVRFNTVYGKNIKPAVNKYLNSPIYNSRLRCFYLIADILIP